MTLSCRAFPSRRFVDWNNDHLQDLIVGESGAIGTVTPAKVRVYLNRGTEAQPLFKDYFYVQADGNDLTLTPEGCMGCFPRVVDWDQDGRKDLLVGVSDGTVRIYMNIADDNNPSFDAGQNLKVGPDAALDLDVGKRPTPIVVDWNNDGMLDIVSGAWDGNIHVFYNCGCGGSVPPRFSTTFTPLGLIVQESGRDLLVPSTRSSPVVMDFDGDGKKDLLTGSTDGTILLYKNIGTDSLPVFSGYSLVPSNGQPIDLASNLRSRPFVCHWTGAKDGYWDLLVGYGDGKIRLYRGIPKQGDLDGDGTLDGDDLTILAKALDKPVPAENSPADLNHDSFVDVLDLRLFADLWLAEHGAEGN
ncbi:MAG: FG-GAP-like repeat-containing protein [Phycisphaerae bacterium]|nr:FG-GAP-like repeat-containing protein [Phycisphaerae bacterium]